MHKWRRTNPDEIRGYSRRQLLLLAQLLVGRGRRMDHKRLCIAHIREVTRQLEQIDDLAPHSRILATLDAKAQHATECTFSKRFESQLV